MELPDRVDQLSALTTLIVSHNALASLPDVFGSLAKLRNFEASHNALVGLPPSLSLVEGLQARPPHALPRPARPDQLSRPHPQVIDVSHNRLASAAPLSALTELVSVNLGSNLLAELPDWRWEALQHMGSLAAPSNLLSVAPAGPA